MTDASSSIPSSAPSSASGPSPARLRRIVDELAETGFQLEGSEQWRAAVLDELDYALRPVVHERRVPTFGAIIAPRV